MKSKLDPLSFTVVLYFSQNSVQEQRHGEHRNYSAAQTIKLRVHYGVHQHVSGDTEFTFDEWNRLRYEEGMLCRNDFDCSWIDNGFYCKRGKLGFKPEAGINHKVHATTSNTVREIELG